MELIQFLESQRTNYLKAFEIALSKLVANKEYVTFVEVLDSKKVVSNNFDTSFYKFRHDLLPKTKDNTYIDVVVNYIPTFFDTPLLIRSNRIEILIESFAWDGCEISFVSGDFDVNCLSSWYKKWINIDNNQTEFQIQELIHSIEFTITGKNIQLEFDFGTAKTNSVIELLDILSRNNINRLLIKSLYK